MSVLSGRRLLSRLNYIHNTPRYGVTRQTLQALKSINHVTVISATFDELHRPRHYVWRKVLPHSRLLTRRWNHAWMCTHIRDLHLEDDPMFGPSTQNSRL
mmetsp:Transcript_23556/g.62015  ORF Transcript_23556/g.62015 Transcript_23556/m.62015 type:complete len:100 (+) Transcript_23556:449-748(+)